MKYWVWLSQLPNIGPVTANRLLKYFGEPESIYDADEDELKKVQGITQKQISSILINRTFEATERIMTDCKRNSTSILTIDDARYPMRARQDDAPVILYYKGTFKEMNTVGVVGARRCTQDTKWETEKIVKEYVRRGTAVISGLAKGVDSYAHTACLLSGGYTVAIVGNGLDICYPCEHVRLMERIEENGLLLSEYPPGTKPTPYTFPRRNRLISAWSDRIVVLSPGKGSGALKTAEYGRKYGREVEIMDGTQ